MDFIEIDGSEGEGGGQVIRTAVSLASIFKKPIRVKNIRAKRFPSGLRPQHLQSVIHAATLCDATLTGATVGSSEITFVPSKIVKSFKGKIETGTAGSISLIAQTIIPISLFGGVELDVSLLGGTEVPNSPTIDYLRKIVLPVYSRFGTIKLSTEKRGYYPKGGGLAKLCCIAGSEARPLAFQNTKENEPKRVSVFSCSRLLPNHVAERQANSAINILERSGLEVLVEMDNGGYSLSPGSSVLVYDVTNSQMVGSSSLGERGKPSELVGEAAALGFLDEIRYCPNVDSHLADMLVTLLACVNGKSSFTAPVITEHFITNVRVASKLSNCKVEYQKEGHLWRVTVIGSSEKPN